MAHLELRDLSKAYGDFRAVRDVCLSVERGEFVALLGPSGCGKTTMLNMIAGFLEPDGGDISMNGSSIVRVPAHRRDLGMVFQSYALFPHLTVQKNVAFGLKMKKTSADEARHRVADALDLVQLRHLADRYPKQLSGGQQQRIALARALVVQPEVLLLDEPLSNLDARMRADMRVELRAIQRDLGVTMVFVTHDQEEALTMSDKIVVVNEGRIEQVGSPRDIYERPASLFVATFVGSSNVFEGVVHDVAPETVTVVLASGEKLQVRRSQESPVEVGTVGSVVVRPERVTVVDGASELPNQLAGTVRDVAYRGGQCDVYVAHAGSDVVASIDGDLSGVPGAGDQVRIVWKPEVAHFFPTRSEGTELDR